MLIGGGATGALVAAYMVGSLTLGGALAQTTPSPSPSPARPASAQPAANETSTKPESANEAAESTALAAQAKISADQAKAAALAKFPGATVGKIELDNENGVLAYNVKLTDNAGARQEVGIDANSGAVLAAQAEAGETGGAADGPETPGAAEGPETAD